MTKSWEMIGWAKEVLGYRQVRYRHAFMFGDVSAMRWAERSLRRGGVAFLLITAEGLLQKAPCPLQFPITGLSFSEGLLLREQKSPGVFAATAASASKSVLGPSVTELKLPSGNMRIYFGALLLQSLDKRQVKINDFQLP